MRDDFDAGIQYREKGTERLEPFHPAAEHAAMDDLAGGWRESRRRSRTRGGEVRQINSSFSGSLARQR